ncbi:hypothetical protein ACH4E5_41295 [Streptomyces afghaniensis]
MHQPQVQRPLLHLCATNNLVTRGHNRTDRQLTGRQAFLGNVNRQTE